MRRALLAIVITAAACWASDSAPDWHVNSDLRARVLFCKSAFVHGYMHGYEQGFHVADIDLNFARNPRDPERIDEYRNPAGYRRQFGDRHVFEKGYREGFRIGYSDGTNERAFRAIDQARAAAAGLADDVDVKPSKIFDEGFSAGYRLGSGIGLRDGRRGTQFRNAAARCDAKVSSSSPDGEYCAGYARGYRFGYADGYVTQVSPAEPHQDDLQPLPASILLQPAAAPPPW